MLSIIISSYQPHYFTALEKNIAETIGVPYEIIKIDNPGIMGICEAYNKGGAKAQYENLLFLHEDVEFISKNWGNYVIEYLGQPKIGVVGLAGSNYLSNSPTPWWLFFKENVFLNITQNDKVKHLKTFNLEQDKEVISLDGVFLACRKEIFTIYKFDPNNKGFHAYDIDFSNRIAYNYTNLVTSKIDLIHYSTGTPNKDWYYSLIKARSRYKIPKKNKLVPQKEYTAFLHLYDNLVKYKFSKQYSIKVLIKFMRPNIIGYRGTFSATKKLLKLILKR